MFSFRRISKEKSNSEKAPSRYSFFERASFSFLIFLKAGMALEGCLVLPLFFLFTVTLLYSLEMVRFQSDAYEAMHQVGSKMCFLAYERVYEQGTAGLFTDSQEEEIKQYLGEQLLPYLCVEEGSDGVIVNTSWDNCGDGNLEIQTSYAMKPFVRWLPIGNIEITDAFFGHGFVGYREGGEEGGKNSDIYVYITPSGSKYHLSQECTYLKINIRAEEAEEISGLRNGSGEKYYPCETCRPGKHGLVYLTEWGNKYHGETDCPSLKRTVYLVPLSEVGGRSACSKCG